MEYDIQSKPTIYKGTKFRSRLEARWACFFDLIGWRWQYEPYDLKGWTPDFIVYGSEKRYILFEVKPYIDQSVLDEYHYKIMRSMSATAQPKCILLDNTFKDDSHGCVRAGYQICDIYREEKSWSFMEPYEVHWKDNQNGAGSFFDIGSTEMMFDGLLWRSDNRKAFLTERWKPSYNSFLASWTKAGEETRFHYSNG